ncbi:porin family protein [Flavobacterium sp. 3-218]
MKKITFLFLTIFSLITFKTLAQDSKITFGVQAGLNYSSYRGFDSYTNDNPGIAYLVGVSVQYRIKNNLSIKADINYERKTQISKTTVEIFPENPSMPAVGGIYDLKIRNYSNYIVLPVMLKYNFSSNKSFYVNGGPFLGYLLKSGESAELDAEGVNDEDVETTKYRKSLDYGLSAGIGKEFKLKNDHKLYVEIRDNLGLSNTSKTEMMSGGSLKTNSFNLIAGYTFN